MQARQLPVIILSTGLIACTVAMVVVACVARAHGDAQFREEPDGIHVTTGAGADVLLPRSLVDAGLYPSINDDCWMICIRGGVIRCIFKPTMGG